MDQIACFVKIVLLSALLPYHDTAKFLNINKGLPILTNKLRKVHYPLGIVSDAVALTFQMPRKPYVCDQCGVSCCSMKDYKRHMELHVGIYRYYCPICGKGCSRSNLLRGHMAAVHNQGRVNCPYCDRTFTRSDGMRKHVSTQHPGKEAPS